MLYSLTWGGYEGNVSSEIQFTMVSERMPNGNINQFVKAHQDENRSKLASFPHTYLPFPLVDEDAVSVLGRRCEGASICTIREWFTEILRGYVFESQSHSPVLMEIAKTNILIDGTGHARLADFGLLTIISDTVGLGSSIHGGTHSDGRVRDCSVQRISVLKTVVKKKHSDSTRLEW